jgi:hypothetical protein
MGEERGIWESGGEKGEGRGGGGGGKNKKRKSIGEKKSRGRRDGKEPGKEEIE